VFKKTKECNKQAAHPTARLIDFPLSNLINSKVRRVFVLTQFNSYSLIQHIHRAYPPEVFGMCGTG